MKKTGDTPSATLNVSGKCLFSHVEDVYVIESWMSGVDLCWPSCLEYSTNFNAI